MFLAINLAIGLALYCVVIAPIFAFFSDREAFIAEQRALLARLTAIARQGPKVQEAARETAEQAKRGELLMGPNEGVINADLQTRLKTMAEQAGGRLRSIQSIPPRTIEQVRLVGSRIEVFGSLRAIQRTVHAIENGLPYLFVADAVIRPSRPLNSQATREEPVIDARLDVFGAVQVEDRSP
jgi:hypothetical protein